MLVDLQGPKIRLGTFGTGPATLVRGDRFVITGVETFLVPGVRHTDEMVRQVDAALLETGRLQAGELVVIVAGSSPSTAGTTNAMRVHRIGGE